MDTGMPVDTTAKCRMGCIPARDAIGDGYGQGGQVIESGCTERFPGGG